MYVGNLKDGLLRDYSIYFWCHLRIGLKELPIHYFTDKQAVLAGGSNVPNDSDLSKGNPVEDSLKQSSLLICSEKAVYVYSLNHLVQVNTVAFI